MRLGGSDAHVDLQVAGYQFPELAAGPEPLDPASWDSNWLAISGSVRPAEGPPWEFRHPALTTWEAWELMTWLRQVGDGTVPAATRDDDIQAPADKHIDCIERLKSAGWLTFTEPNLSFAVGAYALPQVKLLIGLSHESAKPPIDVLEPQRCQIAVVANRQEVQTAAADLQEQLVNHPAR